MAAPSFVNAGTGATDATGPWSYTCQASGAAGRVFIVQILQDGTTNATLTAINGTNIESLLGTDNDWTKISGPLLGGEWAVGASEEALQHIFIGRALSTSAPTISGNNGTSEDLYIRSYQFTDVNTGSLRADVIENGTAGIATNGADTSGTVSDTGVTTLGPDRLALNFVAINDDNAINVFTGETGGDWTLATAGYAESSGTDGSIGLQIATAYTTSLLSPSVTSDQIYGSGGTSEQAAQSFASPGACTLTQVAIYGVDKQGTPTDDLIIEIQTDSGGVPSGTVVGTGATIPAASLGSGWTIASVSATLSASTTYWFVVRRSGARSTSNYYQIRQSSASYGSGQAATMASGAWTGQAYDYTFGLGTSLGGTINGGTATNADSGDGWGVVGFALIGTTVVDTTRQPRYGFVHMNDPGIL